MSAGADRKGVRWALWLPLALFAGFVALVLIGLLRPANREVESAMIGKPLPQFDLRAAISDRPGLARAQFVTSLSFLALFLSVALALAWILLFFKLRARMSGNGGWTAAYRFWVRIFALSFVLTLAASVPDDHGVHLVPAFVGLGAPHWRSASASRSG